MFPLMSWAFKNVKRHPENVVFYKCREDTLKMNDSENHFANISTMKFGLKFFLANIIYGTQIFWDLNFFYHCLYSVQLPFHYVFTLRLVSGKYLENVLGKQVLEIQNWENWISFQKFWDKYILDSQFCWIGNILGPFFLNKAELLKHGKHLGVQLHFFFFIRTIL